MGFAIFDMAGLLIDSEPLWQDAEMACSRPLPGVRGCPGRAHRHPTGQHAGDQVLGSLAEFDLARYV